MCFLAQRNFSDHQPPWGQLFRIAFPTKLDTPSCVVLGEQNNPDIEPSRVDASNPGPSLGE